LSVSSAAAVSTFRVKVDDGIELSVDVAGSPHLPSVVLMHGGGQTRFSWQGAVHQLVRAGYRVVNFDARGHGDSGWAGPGGYGLARHALDLRQLILERVAGPVALVGASLGGATALRAMADGMRPAAVVLVDIVPRPDPAGVQRIRDFMLKHPDGFASLEEAADDVATYNPHRPRPSDLSGLRRNLRLADGRWYWHWDPAFLGREIATELAELHATIDGARAAADVPVALIRGMSSEVVKQQGIEELREALPRLQLIDVPKAGHMVAGDRNDAFNHGMLTFLAQHFPA
jgi:pimeloyl-ACP methyl ester carboxylesterase